MSHHFREARADAHQREEVMVVVVRQAVCPEEHRHRARSRPHWGSTILLQYFKSNGEEEKRGEIRELPRPKSPNHPLPDPVTFRTWRGGRVTGRPAR